MENPPNGREDTLSEQNIYSCTPFWVEILCREMQEPSFSCARLMRIGKIVGKL